MADNQPYIVSARKYRPATFQTVVGQRALTATLKNAIKGGKLAQAYLFCGPRGVGKTSCARIFAKTINCLNPTSEGEACGECESCKAIEKGNSFNLVELDAASNNSVDDIRNITDQVNVPAQNGRYRVFIIDEVHMLSNQAFNAFLKTLEEPPKNVVFILATTERHKVIPTILSRCQIYDFRRITVNDIIDHLQYVAENEGVNAEKEALGVIALKADGAMRDALSIFDQVVASTHGELTYSSTIDALNVLDNEYYFRLIDTFKKGDVGGALLTFKEITEKGFDAQFFVNGLASHIRDMMVAADPRTLKLLETSEEMEKKYASESSQFPPEWYYSALQILNDCDYNYRLSGNKRLSVELALIKLSRLLSVPFEEPAASEPQERPAEKRERPALPQEEMARKESDRIVQSNPASVAKATVKTPIPRRPAAGKPTSFRISSQDNNEQKSSDAKEKLNKEFSQEQLEKVWENFIISHQDQRILTAAMRAYLPQRIDGGNLKAIVDHPAQQQAFETSMAEILKFLRENLENESITLKVELSEGRDEREMMNPKEFLKKTIEENEVLAKFLKDIDAEFEG